VFLESIPVFVHQNIESYLCCCNEAFILQISTLLAAELSDYMYFQSAQIYDVAAVQCFGPPDMA